MLTDFQNSFNSRLSDKFATNSYLNIPPHLKYVAMSLHYLVKYECQKNGGNVKICIVINDKSQGSAAKHLSWDGLLHYKFISHFANKRIFKIGEHLAKLQAKWLIVS